MDKKLISNLSVDEQSIENFATQEAAEIVEIDMTTPEYTADTCTLSNDSFGDHSATNPSSIKAGV